MGQIKFGTDGWRAVIAEDFTFANVARVAQATADYWAANPVAGTQKKVVVGYDRRFLSDQFARRTAEVFLANGFEVLLTDRPTPTPSVSYAVKAQKAVGGVMITASHNPAAFNGFKLKAHFGGSAEPSMCQGIEALLDRNPVVTDRSGREPHRASPISGPRITRPSRSSLISNSLPARNSASRTMLSSASGRVALLSCSRAPVAG